MLNNVVLIGFMGTGKTVIGREVARRLNYDFADTDILVEKEEGRTVSEIFQESGEAYFRKIERKVIRTLSDREGTVIATGGGAVIDPENVVSLRRRGLLVCLAAEPQTILSRLKENRDRPLLNSSDRLLEIQKLLEARRPYYEQGDYVLKTDRIGTKQAATQIQKWLTSRLDREVRVELPQSPYRIRIGWGILGCIGEEMNRQGLGPKVAVVTNPRVGRFYAKTVLSSLRRSGFAPTLIEIPDGERFKTVRWINAIYDTLIRHRFERGSSLVALGGGVIGDMTGFAAATYLRGISYIQVPTTLAAQVDSSIGGKTGVNHAQGKNLIGAFYQPRLVYTDVKALETLDRRNYLSGLAEVIKYGVIADAEFFSFLEKHLAEIIAQNPPHLFHAIQRSCEIKAQVVQEDEKEAGRRKILNYGHTLGHALEAVSRYKKYLHGEAISIGMVFAASLAYELNLCSQEVVDRQRALLKEAGLPVARPEYRPIDLLRAMAHDKKVREGKVYFVLADRIGHVIVRSVQADQIRRALLGKRTKVSGK